MTEKMLKFVKIGKQTPPKRKVDQRKEDFEEIYEEFITGKAKEQSSRCSQCGVPFCQIHCPLHNNIPDWLKLTAEGRLEEAYELSQSTNNMPEVCGRICPQDRLCEGNCVIEQSGHGTVTIGSVEKYITETAWNNGWVKPISVLNEKLDVKINNQKKIIKKEKEGDLIIFNPNQHDWDELPLEINLRFDINKMKNENIIKLEIDNKMKHLEKYLRSQWSWKTYVFIFSLFSVLTLVVIDLEINFIKLLNC